MDALILTCGTGGGHNAAAHALEEEMVRRGHNVQLMNPYALQSEELAAQIDQVYVRLVQASPKAFGVVYRLGNMYRRLPGKSPVYFINARMVSCLQKYLEEHPVDVILMTHLFPGEILTNMKRQGMAVPRTVFVSTDYTCIPFTEEIDCDAYVVPAEDLRTEYVARGLPSQRLYTLGIPVRRCFTEPMTREEARSALGLDPRLRYILIAGGSVGAGKMIKVMRMLERHYRADANTRFITICGSNKRLSRQLRETFGQRVIVLEHTDQMALYLKACDLFLTKPGGLSSTEAAVASVPMIHISPIPGCETRNLNYFGERGMSMTAVHHLSDLIPAIERLEAPDRRAAMALAQKRINPRAASDICDLAERIVAHRTET